MKRDAHSLTLDFADELIIDNFAGGGGTSEGLEQAFGRPVDIAINHDPHALAMHAINHPLTKHLCESVWDVNPVKVTRNQPVGLVWLSPDCKHFSKAKGGTPVAKEIRGLAWVGMRWIATTKPRVMMLENVEEFQDWGPLIIDGDGNARPDPAKKGKTFESFVRQLRGHGYVVDWRELRACDNGAPTIRKRLFMVARRDGLPICWPEQTHGAPTNPAVIAGKLLPFRTAAECIDFSLDAQSIFDRKRALVDNTERRVAKGLWRHVLTNPTPFIVGVGGCMGQSPARSVDAPAQTITAKADSCVAQPILQPIIVGAGGPSYSGKPVATDKPLGALTTENHRAVAQGIVTPFISEHANSSNQRNMPADQPLRTQMAQVKGGHFSVVAPSLAPLRGTSEGHMNGHEVEGPLSTVSAGGTHHALVGANLITVGYGEREGQAPRTQDIEQPAGTAVAGGVKQAIVAAHLVDMGHGESSATGAVRWSHGHRSAETPLNAITASGGTAAVVAGYMTKFNTGSVGHGLDEPTGTITAGGEPKRPGTGVKQGLVAVHLNHLTHHGERAGLTPDGQLPTITGAHRGEQAMISACLEQANGGFYEGDGRAADAPISTITTTGKQQRLVMAYYVKYYGNEKDGISLTEPIHTLPTKDRIGLVQVAQVPLDCIAEEYRARARKCAGLLRKYLPEHFTEDADMVLVWQHAQWWVLVDITLRMLKPPELFLAQGFPRGYIIHEIPDPALLFKDGVQAANVLALPRIALNGTLQVRMCGNSVSPMQARALAEVNFRHERQIARRAA